MLHILVNGIGFLIQWATIYTHSLAQIEPASSGRKMRFSCPTCPYVCSNESKIVRKVKLKKKDVDPIIRWEESMQSLPKGQATCAKCGNNEAYFYQMQIRSADEPMTTFYTCCNEGCKHEWRED
ncbi:DNA-directed RNA polymerase III subunit RPC10-like isoform X2 [Asparagus officinalis]|uniref:DNA-directed RNA polymerase III subunit RPC10-like isoform X2 n=1 Tax=Asparagus officinalis TaxID=4686 RepID=UPI00098E6ED1|nr:DNA-directed RNA polymerase III subunit RPC10-like isoform X2 [Asparagus officinalis]